MPISHGEAQRVLNYTLKGTAYTPATIAALALFTVPVTAEDTAPTEAAFTGYARQAVTLAAADTGGNTIKNSAVITFPANTSGTSTIVAIGIFDQTSAGGSLKYYANLCKPIVHNAGDPQLSWAVGALTIRLGAE